MKLRTQIPLEGHDNNQIDHHSKIVLLGSCFAESIGEKLEYFKFQSTLNPFGILFHPIALENSINFSVDKKEFSDEDVFFHNELWHCFDAHSKRSDWSKPKLLASLNENKATLSQEINQASHIVITLGTAWVYKLIAQNKIVANCHKLPQNQFKKELLSVDEISASLNRILEKIRFVNPHAKIIFTVSPVRHLKDGFIENSQSKAHLITAVHAVIKTENESFYFPSYELMMDELRDYRFYKEDMIHPNKTAINYIWEKFHDVWISSSSNEIMKEVALVQKGLLHKPFNPESKGHQEFVKQLKTQQNILASRFPHIIF